MKTKNLVVSLFAAALTTLVAPAHSETYFTTTVNKLMPYAGGDVIVTFASSPAACTNTNSPKRFYLQVGAIGLTADGLKNIYTTLMYAAAGNKSILVYFDETRPYCNITRVSIGN